MPISFGQLHTSKLGIADVSADLNPLYTMRNILFEATFFERTSFFEVAVSYNIVFTNQQHYSHHRTRDFKVGSALLVGQTTGSGAFFAVHGRLHVVGDFSKNFQFEMILPVNN